MPRRNEGHPLILGVLWLHMLGAGCQEEDVSPSLTTSSHETPSSTGSTASGSLCEHLAGKKYRTTVMHDGGLGPDGPTYRYWTVTFSPPRFLWDLSDAPCSGTYTCAGDSLVIGDECRNRLGGPLQAEVFDASTLLWDHEKYIISDM